MAVNRGAQLRHLDRAKFHQNRPNGFGGITFFHFQDGRCQPSWIFKFLIFS